MDILFDILVNLSPLISILLFLIYFKLLDLKNTKWAEIFLVVHSIGMLAFVFAVIDGYGNTIVAVVMQIMIDTLFLFLLFYLFNDSPFGEKVYGILSGTVYFCASFHAVYVRLRNEGILEIECVDEMLNKLKSIDYMCIFQKIINNEWFKGIAIAALGGIIGGMVLDQINKKNK